MSLHRCHFLSLILSHQGKLIKITIDLHYTLNKPPPQKKIPNKNRPILLQEKNTLVYTIHRLKIKKPTQISASIAKFWLRSIPMVVISSFLLGFGGFLEVEWTWRHIAMVGLSCVVGFWDQNTPLWEERSNFRQKIFTPVFRHATFFRTTCQFSCHVSKNGT